MTRVTLFDGYHIRVWENNINILLYSTICEGTLLSYTLSDYLLIFSRDLEELI